MNCYKCGKEILLDRKVFRQDTCPQCNAYLHCCYNCRFHDRHAYHECRESQADLVHDKEMANFCDYFEGISRPVNKMDKADEARRRLENLFKKGS